MNNVEVMEEAEKKSEREEESKAENKKESGQVNNSLEENAVSTQEIEVSQEIGEENSLERFEEMLDPRVLRAVKEMGFEKLSPIQVAAIPALMEGSDIIGQAQTGTGKTAAFGIPLIQRIDPDNKNLQAVILCPTRELAIQAAEELRKLAKYMHGIKALPVYGGQDISRQIAGLRGVQIIVGTPGRVMDHMRRHTIKLEHVNMVVLDEADEMLNMGFREDMELILGQIPGEHQTALFSATMPKPILEITGKFQKDAKHIKIAAKELTIPLVSQSFYKVKNQDKDAACVRLLEFYEPKLTLIFCNTKKKVDELAEVLKLHGYQAEGLHGDMSQNQRDVAMNRFRNGSTSILIATDVAARGIDVDDVEAVINYDIPQDIEYYVHRIGRTGRAGRTGMSFTLAGGREVFRIREIERVCNTNIKEKKLPNASRVMKVKARRLLEQALLQKESPDLEEMTLYINEMLEKEECTAVELAAMLLKMNVGEKAEEIEADDYRPAFRDRRGGREERGGRTMRGFGEGRGRSRGSERGSREKGWSRGGEKSRSRDSERSLETGERRHRRSDRSYEEGRSSDTKRRNRTDGRHEEGRDGDIRRHNRDAEREAGSFGKERSGERRKDRSDRGRKLPFLSRKKQDK